MPNFSRRWLAAGLCTLVLTACGERKSIIGPPPGRLSVSAASLPPTYGCASLEVTVHAKKIESLSIVGNRCGDNLRLALGGTPEYDKARKVVRIPLVLENGGTTSFRDPARVYAWEDSLTVLGSPARNGEDDDEPDDFDDPADGRTAARRAANQLRLVGADSAIGLTAQLFTGAVLWRYDASLAASAPQILPPGARSQVRWIEVRKRRGVHKFSMTLWASATVASAPAEAIIIVVDKSVVGTLVHDTVAMVGDPVAYQFTAAPGYTNVAVRVDQLRAPTSGVVVADADQHVIFASADRLVTVPVGAEALYASAQAVVTSPNTAAAFQNYLDAQYAYVHAHDAAQAERDIADVNHLVFNFLDNRAQVRRVDAALDGHSFRIGPTTLQDPGGDPISDPVIDPGVFNRLAAPPLTKGAMPARAQVPARAQMLAAFDDTVETSVFLYVNGIRTLESGASSTADKLDGLRLEIPLFQTQKIIVRYFYSRTYAVLPTRERLEQECARDWGNAAAAGFNGMNSYADYMATCTVDHQYQSLATQDIVESIRQVFAILTNSDALEKDAEYLANDIQHYRNLGWHVLVVPHSQGNLMANQAIHHLVQTRKYTAQLDTTCIAVVSLASPTSVRWDLPNDHYIFPVRVEGDLVPSTGGSTYQPTSTILSRQIAAEIASHHFNPLARAYLTIKYGFTTLHSPNDSYLEYESRLKVRDGMSSVYSACAVANIKAAETPMTVLTGLRFAPQILFLNAFKDTIATRVIANDKWESIDSTIANPIGDGIYRAGALGTTQVEATRFEHKAVWDVTVNVPPPAAIVGSWSGTWIADTSPDEGTISMVISGSGNNMTMFVNWTQGGQAFSGASDFTGTIGDGPSGSGASSWIVYKKPGEPSGFNFFRFFAVATRNGTNTATGSAGTGSGIDGWTITMTRTQP